MRIFYADWYERAVLGKIGRLRVLVVSLQALTREKWGGTAESFRPRLLLSLFACCGFRQEVLQRPDFTASPEVAAGKSDVSAVGVKGHVDYFNRQFQHAGFAAIGRNHPYLSPFVRDHVPLSKNDTSPVRCPRESNPPQAFLGFLHCVKFTGLATRNRYRPDAATL